MKRAVVIGSGIGGLVSAILLQRDGWQVDVLEQHYRAGGLLHRFFRDGVGYDTGFHYVGSAAPDQLFGRVLSHLGVVDKIKLLPLDPDGFDELAFPGVALRVPVGLDRWRDRLVDAFPHERAGIDRYVVMNRQAVSAYGLYNLDLAVAPESVLKWEERTLQSVLDECFRDPQLKALLTGQAALYGVPPEHAPFGLHAIVTDHFSRGAYGIAGGGDKLALALVRQLRALGGKLWLKTAADRIEVTDQAASAVFAGERRFPADVVIANVHPKHVLRWLPDGAVRKVYADRVTATVPGLAHTGLYLRTEGDLSPLLRRNRYDFATWDSTAHARPAVPGDVPFVFATAPGWRDPPLPGAAGVVLALVTADWGMFARWADTTSETRPDEYLAYKDGIASSTIARLREFLPDLVVTHTEVSTPLSMRAYTRSPNGATYGHYHSVAQMGRYRLPIHIKVRNVLQVGQCTGFPGICGAAMSAYVAVGGMLGMDRLVGELKAR